MSAAVQPSHDTPAGRTLWRMMGVGTILKWLGIASGTLSLLLLIVNARQVGLSGPVSLVVTEYEAWVTFLLGWLDEPLSAVLSWVANLFGEYVYLDPGWKHGVIAMLMFIGALLRMAHGVGGRFSIRFVALIVSYAVFGGLVMGLRFSKQTEGMVTDPTDAIVGLLIVLALYLVVTMTVVGALFTAWRMLRGDPEPVEPLRLYAHVGASSALLLLSVPVGTAIFLALNAGLKLAGL